MQQGDSFLVQKEENTQGTHPRRRDLPLILNKNSVCVQLYTISGQTCGKHTYPHFAFLKSSIYSNKKNRDIQGEYMVELLHVPKTATFLHFKISFKQLFLIKIKNKNSGSVFSFRPDESKIFQSHVEFS